MKNLIFIAFLFLFASQNQYGSQGLFSEIATYFETMLLERKDRLSNIRSENHCLHKILKYNKETMWKRKQGFSKYNQSFEELRKNSKKYNVTGEKLLEIEMNREELLEKHRITVNHYTVDQQNLKDKVKNNDILKNNEERNLRLGQFFSSIVRFSRIFSGEDWFIFW